MDRFQFQKVIFLGFLLAVGCGSEKETSKKGACLHHDGRLRAGFAKVSITPENIEGYVDAPEYEDGVKVSDGNLQYDPGEKTLDTNKNGKWEPLWIAGFSNGRAAQGVHDPIWARTMALERDGELFVFTVLDLVGFLPNDIAKIRDQVRRSVGACYALRDENIVVASTHTHEAPDTMGIWGEAPFKTGIVPSYMEFIHAQAAASIESALERMQPVSAKFGYALAATDINDDSRFPKVIDDDINSAQFIGDDGKTVGTLVEYSMHPEVLWSDNPLITSDFPHYFRQRMEAKLGGISVFATGMVGGLMTPLSDIHTFEQAEWVGHSLADAALASLKKETSVKAKDCKLEFNSQKLYLPVANATFQIMIDNNILAASRDDLIFDGDAVCALKGCVVVDVVAANVCGKAQFVTVPGELFPELGMGGYDRPHEYAGPFSDAPLETPLRTKLMSGKHRFVFGLANGEFGYIIPKSQWDLNEYEETVSLGPDTAPRLMNALEALLAPLR